MTPIARRNLPAQHAVEAIIPPDAISDSLIFGALYTLSLAIWAYVTELACTEASLIVQV